MHRYWFAAALAFATCTSQAADNGIYLGAAISQSEIDDLGTGLDIDDTGWKLIVGIRPLDFIGAELNYVDLGSERQSIGGLDARVEGTALTGYGVLFLPLPFLDLYAKAGVAYWETEGGGDLSAGVLDDDGTEFAWGVGAQVRFWSLAARLEYEAFDIGDSEGADVYSLGVTWTFL